MYKIYDDDPEAGLKILANRDEQEPEYVVVGIDKYGRPQTVEFKTFLNEEPTELVVAETKMEPYNRVYKKSSSGMSEEFKQRLKNIGKIIAVTIAIAASLYGCEKYISVRDENTEGILDMYNEYVIYAKENNIPINEDTYIDYIKENYESNVNRNTNHK